MSPTKSTYDIASDNPGSMVREEHIEYGFLGKLQSLKYDYRPDITNRSALEANFRQKFEALNRVRLTDSEFARLLDEIITPDVFTASKTLRSINSFKAQLFGFTGTPIFEANASLQRIEDEQASMRTTADLFQKQLHAYTIKTHKKGLMQQLFPSPEETNP